MQREILHLSVPDFPIALARVVDASLRTRPVAVAPTHSDRALVQCLSDEARAEGLHEGMALHHARRLCPNLHLLPPNLELLNRGTQALHELSARLTPLWEPATPGRLFLDLTGSRRLLGPGRDAAAHLEREIQADLRLNGTLGVASNKLVSRIAAGYLTHPGVCDVFNGSEESFIGPLPVSVLPGVGQAREALLLSDLNLRRVNEVAALSVAQLRLAFGPFAPLLHQRARGIDPSPVRLPRRSNEICEETFLPQADNDDHILTTELCRLVEACGLRLRDSGRKTTRLVLTVTYVDGLCEQRTRTLTTPVNHDLLLFAACEELFAKASARRVRIKALRLVCSRITANSEQLPLFAEPERLSPRDEALQQALDLLRRRHGMQVVQRGLALAH